VSPLLIASAPRAGPVAGQPHLVLGTKRLSRESPARQAGRPVPRHPLATLRLRPTEPTVSLNHFVGTRWALLSHAVPGLDGRGRLERATHCEAGKSARRFLAASPVSVIRVDLRSSPAIIPP